MDSIPPGEAALALDSLAAEAEEQRGQGEECEVEERGLEQQPDQSMKPGSESEPVRTDDSASSTQEARFPLNPGATSFLPSSTPPASAPAGAPSSAPPTSAFLSRNRSSSGLHDARKLRFTTLGGREVARAHAGAGAGEGRGRERDDEDEPWRNGWRGLKSDPGTPNLSETAEQIRRTLSLASLAQLNTTLSTLAPSAAPELLSAAASSTARALWRPAREPRKVPRDAERALVLALRRGMRSGALGWGVRAGVGLMVALLRGVRMRRVKWALVRFALFSAGPFRFGAMMGTFTLLNTLTLHLLRLAPPASYLVRRARHIWRGGAKAGFGPPARRYAGGEVMRARKGEGGSEGYFLGQEGDIDADEDEEDTGERRWQAAVAGAVGSIGLLWEERTRRVGIAQQMFVRGLQASYNSLALAHDWSVPYGDMLVFGFCCGQIMFAFLLSPETIPAEYNNWILKASHAEPAAIPFNRKLERQGIIDVRALEKAARNKNITPRNAGEIRDLIANAAKGLTPPPCLPCSVVHPWLDSCWHVQAERFFAVVRFMLPVYSALHFIPMLVLRGKHVARDPLGMLFRATQGTLRSSSFLGVFVVIFQALLCIRSQTLRDQLGFGTAPIWLMDLLKRKQTFWLMGFSTCLSLLVEEKKRRAELAMYVLPRGLESAWSSARRRAWVPLVPFGESILAALAMGMVMDAYKHQPQALSGIVRKVMYQLIGPP